jgi:hypothetical protein
LDRNSWRVAGRKAFYHGKINTREEDQNRKSRGHLVFDDLEGIINTFPATFETDIQPLFTENGVWFESSQACLPGWEFDITEENRDGHYVMAGKMK